MAEAKHAPLTLPASVATRVDLGRLLRETEAITDFLKQSAIREPGTPVKLPKTSRLLDDVVTTNKLNILHQEDLSRLHAFLISLKAKAPVLHMSFSADPPPLFTQKLVAWLRQEIHPFLLISAGLQPNIGAGCVVRSTNKYFDFSLRQRFIKSRGMLIEKLADASEPAQVQASSGEALL